MATSPTPPSSSLPQPLSYQQLVSQFNSSYASSLGINDLNAGSANVSFSQVASLMTARASGDIFQILKDYNLSRATGPALQNLAIEYGVPPIGAKVATSSITVIDLSFQKISTVIYAGVNPPIPGSGTIYVSDASSFPATGSLYIGRGTVNIEGPIAYTLITPVASYYAITLSPNPTTKYHNIGESVILAQGGVRSVPINSTVLSPGIGTTPNVLFTVTQTTTILDGETTAVNIPVVAQLPGSTANVSAGAISAFSGNPPGLPNVSVNNPLAVTTGLDPETDDELRVRVKNSLASTGLGTITAIENALKGVQSPTSSDTIVSTDVLESATSATVYIDNGGILEATHVGVPIEAIVNSALGGEKYFQLVTGGTQTSVTKALVQTVSSEPFGLFGGEVLAVVVGDITYNHTFNATDFANPGSATAYEVSASINGDTVLNFEAVTAGNGTYVVIRPEDESTNIIQVTTPASAMVVNANNALQFPSQESETLRLYKNGVLLTEDGATASIFTNAQIAWSPTLATGVTFGVSVDKTPATTYTFTDSDFVAEGTYSTLAASNSLQSWVNVFNAKITGITASIVGSTIEMSSNLGAVDRASISVVTTSTPSLISEGMFSVNDLSSTGVASQYTLDRNTAQIELVDALKPGDTLSAGTETAQANIEAGTVPSGSVTLAADAHVWISIDDNATIIPTITNGSLLSVSQIGPNVVRYTSNSPSAFSNVLPGDYVIVWTPQLAAVNQLEGRVHAQTATTLDIEVTVAEYTAVTPVSNVPFIQGFVVVRTSNVPQKFTVSSGTITLDVAAQTLQSQTDQLTFGVLNNTNITVVTNTYDLSGQITIATADQNGAILGFVQGITGQSQTSLIAFNETQASTAELPLFFHSPISADAYAEPPYTFLTNFTSSNSLSGFDPNEMLGFLNPYGGIDDEQPSNETAQILTYSGSSITILDSYPDIRRLRTNDRFFVANPLDFGYNDTSVTIVDNNTIGETYTMPLYRRAIANTNYALNNFSFDAYDIDAGPTTSFATNFSGFDFSNFKALLQAKYVVQGANSQTALLYRSVLWGRSGEDVNISYVYPTTANQPLSSVVSVTATNDVSIAINLISGNPVTTTIANNTQWNVTVTSNTPVAGVDQVTYTWNSVGTAPGLSLGGGGQYVTILTSTGFNVKNTGTFRVSTAIGYTPTSTSFSVQVPTGTAFAQSGAITTNASGMSFYAATPTTAAAINTYVSANLSKYVTTTIVNDGGMSGSGIIVLSTYEGTNFVTASYYLKDGINWILSSNTSGSPQFTFKDPLTYYMDTGYAFNAGDEVRLVPTTMEQVKNLWNVLAVTGFTTVGTIETSDRGKKLQLSTNTVGSTGSIQVVGGSGNIYSFPVLTSGELLGNSSAIIAANSIASQAVASDQWFRLQAVNAQSKDAGFAANTDVTVVSNSPLPGQSTITLTNQNANQLYFGAPRNFPTVNGRTFRVEKQGSLTCLSWTGAGGSPNFSVTADLNDSGGWTVNVSSAGVYTVASGATTFAALSIGDLITISGCVNASNNGTFFIESVTASAIGVSNTAAVTETGTAITAGEFHATLSVSEGDTVIISTTSPFAALNQGNFRVVRMSQNSVWYENSESVEEEQTCTTGTQIRFYQYEATVPGDKLVVNGTVLGTDNAGTYSVISVTSPLIAVVSGIISSQVATNLGSNYSSFSVVEGVPYTGYKQVEYVCAQPGAANSNYIVFNTSEQYEKITFSGGVTLTSLGKLNFSTAIINGVDSYNYDTGLIGQANRVTYGDPRDPITYPGVSAAGTDIFHRESLLKSVSIALAIRTNIGVSFAQITAQIQSSVYSLISSNPVGQSIDLSSIVETVRAIPGVTSVVLTNPAYTVANDEIQLVTGQKAFLSSLSSITVSLIGS